MALNTNFNDVAELNDRELKVTGTTDPPVEGWQLLSRNIIVMQGAVTVQTPATKARSWKASRRIPPDGFSEDKALATGTETYYYQVGGPEKPASFITITWSQMIQIEAQ